MARSQGKSIIGEGIRKKISFCDFPVSLFSNHEAFFGKTFVLCCNRPFESIFQKLPALQILISEVQV